MFVLIVLVLLQLLLSGDGRKKGHETGDTFSLYLPTFSEDIYRRVVDADTNKLPPELHVYLVVDASGSIGETTYNDHTRSICKEIARFSSLLAEEVYFTGVKFSSNTEVLGRRGRSGTQVDLDTINLYFDEMNYDDAGTVLAPAIQETMTMIDTEDPSGMIETVVYVLTDGLPWDKDESIRLANILKSYPQVTIRVIGIGSSRDTGVLHQLASEDRVDKDGKVLTHYFDELDYERLHKDLRDSFTRVQIQRNKKARYTSVQIKRAIIHSVSNIRAEKVRIDFDLGYLQGATTKPFRFRVTGIPNWEPGFPVRPPYFEPGFCDFHERLGRDNREGRCTVTLTRTEDPLMEETLSLKDVPLWLELEVVNQYDQVIEPKIIFARKRVNFTISHYVMDHFTTMNRIVLIGIKAVGKTTWANTWISACSGEVTFPLQTCSSGERVKQRSDNGGHCTKEFEKIVIADRVKGWLNAKKEKVSGMSCPHELYDLFRDTSRISLDTPEEEEFLKNFFRMMMNGSLPVRLDDDHPGYHLNQFVNMELPKPLTGEERIPMDGMVFFIDSKTMGDPVSVERVDKFLYLLGEVKKEWGMTYNFPVIGVVVCKDTKACTLEVMNNSTRAGDATKGWRQWFMERGIPQDAVFDSDPYIEEDTQLNARDGRIDALHLHAIDKLDQMIKDRNVCPKSCHWGKCRGKVCDCLNSGATGKFCEDPICEDCELGTCKSPGECVCPSGYIFKRRVGCVPVPKCPCKRHGSCDDPKKPKKCTDCDYGWKHPSTNCDTPICRNECGGPLMGACVYPYDCECKAGYVQDDTMGCAKVSNSFWERITPPVTEFVKNPMTQRFKPP